MVPCLGRAQSAYKDIRICLFYHTHTQSAYKDITCSFYHACTHTHARIHVRAHTHMHTHTHTQTFSEKAGSFNSLTDLVPNKTLTLQCSLSTGALWTSSWSLAGKRDRYQS